MTFSGERLRACRKALKLSQAELGERAGLSQGAISDLERGIALETNKLLDLARVCGVSPDWLLGKSEGGHDQAPRTGQVIEGPPRWSNLKPEKEPQSLPEVDVRGGASYGGGIRDEDWQDGDKSGDRAVAHWGFPPAFVERELGLAYGFADVVRVRGDSMDDGTAKALTSGDRVIVDRQDTDVSQGGIFVVFDGDGVIIKQVELVRGHTPPRIVCKSLNTRYDPIPLTLEDPVRVIGRVAGRISRV